MKILALDPIYFDLNKGDVRADSKAALGKIVEYLKTFADLKIKAIPVPMPEVVTPTNYSSRRNGPRARPVT